MLNFPLCAESSWERLAGCGKPVVIYGTGNGADAVLNELLRLGVTVDGVAASDDFVRGQFFRGYKVKKLSELKNNCIVAVAFASSLPEIMARIDSLAGRIETLVPCVPVTGNEIFNRNFVLSHKDEINRAYALMADEESRRVFAGYVNFEFGGKLSDLKAVESHKDEAFLNILRLSARENYLDIGAYRGDTIAEFLQYCRNAYSSIVAAEPDKKSFNKLSEYLKDIKKSTALNVAVADSCGERPFASKAGRQSAFDKSGKAVTVITVDALAENTVFTYIKVDSEGAEEQVIRGAADTLSRLKPKLNIAAYHRAGDIFNLPLLINKVNPEYKIFLRHHPYIPAFDTNMYCI